MTVGLPTFFSLDLGFDSGDISNGWNWGASQYQSGQTDRLQAVTHPVYKTIIEPSTHSLQGTVHKGDMANNGTRAEVVLTHTHFREGDEVFFHWYTFFPAGFDVSPDWQVYTQWHDDDIPGKKVTVPLGFNINKKRDPNTGQEIPMLNLRIRGDYYDGQHPSNWCPDFQVGKCGYLWIDRLQTVKWYEIWLHIKWSKKYQGDDTPNDYSDDNILNSPGFIEGLIVVHDERGTIQVSGAIPRIHHPNLGPEVGDAYMKQGIYLDNDTFTGQTQRIYHDGMKVFGWLVR